MTRNRAERRHPMMRLKKLIVALMIDVNAIGSYGGSGRNSLFPELLPTKL